MLAEGICSLAVSVCACLRSVHFPLAELVLRKTWQPCSAFPSGCGAENMFWQLFCVQSQASSNMSRT